MDTPQTEWSLCLLECYVRIDREWRTDKLAWSIFRNLSASAQAYLRKLDQAQGKQSHRGWELMLEIIARDQQVFRDIIDQKASGRLSEIGARFGLSEGAVRKIYAAYHRQGTRLLGKESPLEQLAKKRSMKEVVDRLERRGEARLRRAQPVPVVCQTWSEVFAWFALALRNLKRYRNGHSPLPWAPPQ